MADPTQPEGHYSESHPNPNPPVELPVNPASMNPEWHQDEFDPPPPPQPPRPQANVPVITTQDYDAPAPPLPQRPVPGDIDVEAQTTSYQQPPPYVPADYPQGEQFKQFQPPPQRIKQTFSDDDNPSNPVHYIRDPHKLIGYLVPFPRPSLPNVAPESIPARFMIYTPPPPPLQKPGEGQKEAKLHKVQRKWQEEVRAAKTSTAKTASWQGVKSKATRGISWAINKTTSSNLDFLGRVSPAHSDDERDHADQAGGVEGHSETHKTVGVEEMVLIYPPTLALTEPQMREEFVNTMLRTKTKAQRDTVIATGLIPVTYAIDILATLVWPFGGLGEIDTVWAYSSFRGAKTARSVTKRLTSTSNSPSTSVEGGDREDSQKLKLTFTQSQRLEVLRSYLDAECHKADSKLFPTFAMSPTESDVLEAIGWTPSDRGGKDHEDKNWEDEQWEMSEVKDDLKNVFTKAAREWRKWCHLLEKNPDKAMKK